MCRRNKKQNGCTILFFFSNILPQSYGVSTFFCCTNSALCYRPLRSLFTCPIKCRHRKIYCPIGYYKLPFLQYYYKTLQKQVFLPTKNVKSCQNNLNITSTLLWIVIFEASLMQQQNKKMLQNQAYCFTLSGLFVTKFFQLLLLLVFFALFGVLVIAFWRRQ